MSTQEKLRRPYTNPIINPPFIPSTIAPIITGICASVITIRPIAGNDPRGVTAIIISIAIKIANLVKNNALFLSYIKLTPFS
ncbi:hypothetical protein SFB1_314G1 [Candidatus Arthromitus sp. SFB-1]|nr:hypothetical protein SFB1_314G1 [Candidatus Arthromitus sp. SFB-1]